MITVYRYGVHYRWTPPAELVEQLRIAHDLREDLVTLQLDHEQAVKDVWSSYPAVAAAEAELTTATEDAERLLTEVAKERSRQRTKRITGPLTDQLAAARKRAKAARVARREAIGEVRDDAKARLDALGGALKAAQKALYADHVQARGLFWATYNDVLDHHRVAVRRVAADRAAGRPAAMRHHRWDGTGSIAVQLQRGAGMPPRSPAMLADAETGRWRNVLALPWIHPGEWDDMTRAEQRRAGRVTVRMRCGAGHIEVPVQVHRMLPSDADVTGARLTVRKVGGDIRAHVTITARVGDPEPVRDGPMLALHLGWRDDADATVVAHWRATSPIRVPRELRDVIATGSGITGTIRMPHSISDRLAAIDTIRAERDERLNALRDDLVAWLTGAGPQPHPTRDDELITAADVARWRSPSRFAWLARVWGDAPPPGSEEIRSILTAWQRWDRQRWRAQEHGRQKAIGHRTDLYRQVAATLSDQVQVLVTDDTSVATIARLPSDLPAEVEQRIAHRRHTAAPGELRAAVLAACARDGVHTLTVSSAGLSRIHVGCGHVNPADDRYLAPVVRCDGCGADYDVDRSATVLMLARAVTPDAPEQGAPVSA